MTNCIICNHSKSSPLYQGILQCQDCGYIYANAQISDDELLKLYKRDYFFGDEYSDYLADRRVLEKNFQKRLSVLRRYIQPEVHRNLLEIGCAYGFFLNLVKNSFSSCQGIDLNKDGTDYARDVLKLEAFQGDFLKHDYGTEIFDVVCLWDTIEHLREPHLYLEKISSHTKKGSLVAITTGDIDSFNARARKQNWRLIHPPTHLHYFSKKTIEKLLQKNGFEVVYSKHCGFYRSLENILYNIFVLRKRGKPFYNLTKKVGLNSLDFYLNMFDIMYVIARKK
jgi:SAM-dependent methyltransferase